MVAPPVTNPQDNEPAILMSPEMKVSQLTSVDLCVQFIFMMTGSDLGTLTLFAVYATRERNRLWQHYGDNGYAWATAQVPLRNQTRDFRLMFVSHQGYSKRAVALSSVSVLDGLCPSGK